MTEITMEHVSVQANGNPLEGWKSCIPYRAVKDQTRRGRHGRIYRYGTVKMKVYMGLEIPETLAHYLKELMEGNDGQVKSI